LIVSANNKGNFSMKQENLVEIGLVAVVLLILTSIVLLRPISAAPAANLVETVRQATTRFKEVKEAEKAGYGLLHGCVTGAQDGAMGVHYANGNLVGDGELDAKQPEALLYEMKDGKLQLVGVEYVVIAEAWDANHDAPPVLMGQLFNFTGSPNRYGLPPFYELHVWSWKNNSNGMFADWNPDVSCETYVGDAAGHHQ
jgi:hypothetical protein